MLNWKRTTPPSLIESNSNLSQTPFQSESKLQSHSSKTEDKASENVLRPQRLKDYIGQKEIKANLEVFLKAAQKRNESMEHVLLHGPPGLGKTSLAMILAREMKVNIKNTSGPAIERPGDLAALLTNLKAGDVLFIDEIHRLRPAVEEILYSAMEDFCLDLVVGKGPSARSMRLTLPSFTLIGATTKLSNISSPLRDRFGNVLKLNFYEVEDIKAIIIRSASILNIDIENEAALCLAQSSRRTPRIANRLLRRARDYSHVHNEEKIRLSTVRATLDLLGIDAMGLNSTDRRLLSIMADQFQGGPVGLSTLSAASHEERATIEDIYEPYLMQLGFLKRTPKGRLLTEKVYNHLGIKSK